MNWKKKKAMIRRNLKWIVPALLLMYVAMSAHEAQAQTAFTTGNQLVSRMQEYEKNDKEEGSSSYFNSGLFVGFVDGVHDATHSKYSLHRGVTVGQLCAVVSKYLKEHPERWSEPASLLVIDALEKAFPKK
jgi:hypothetical protein